jgi:phosphosulfolactate phosphohydrolase-like enzyme/MFS family permease
MVCEGGHTWASKASTSTKDLMARMGHDKIGGVEISPYAQDGYRLRCDWGLYGAHAITERAAIVAVVDVLSFTTTLTVAADAGVEVFPYRWRDASAARFAREHDAVLAVGRSQARPGEVSLSPGTVRGARDVRRLVLPSPNGSTIAQSMAGVARDVIGVSLRNATAAAAWTATRLGGDETSAIAVVAAGEQWRNASLRPAVEDLWGAGAYLARGDKGARVTRTNDRKRSSPYLSVLRHSAVRRMLPGYVLSSLGDGMAVVAVSWFAIQLAPAEHREIWVAIAAAAYTLPGAVGAMVLDRPLRHRAPAQLAGWDALLRACALGAIPVVYAFSSLTIGLYVTLLAASSILHSWGQAGVYTLVARLLPEEKHLAGNSLLSSIGAFCTVVGPLAASPLIVRGGAELVVAVDAITFAVLAMTFLLLMRRVPAPAPEAREPGASSGLSVVLHSPALFGLLGLSFVFFLLFGTVYVALPLHVSENLRGDAGLLGAFYSAFGIGAVIGAVLTSLLRRARPWLTAIGLVIAFGAAMTPLGLEVPTPVALVSFAAAGALWPPYASLSTALIQRTAPAAQLQQVLATSSAVRVLSVPAGTMLGGPLVTLFGPRTALSVTAAGILALGIGAAVIVLLRPYRRR